MAMKHIPVTRVKW